tara:strand:+ start:835 stop:990 length:156 start_codon:yes stop_codon:yes gene_type:complete
MSKVTFDEAVKKPKNENEAKFSPSELCSIICHSFSAKKPDYTLNNNYKIER